MDAKDLGRRLRSARESAALANRPQPKRWAFPVPP